MGAGLTGKSSLPYISGAGDFHKKSRDVPHSPLMIARDGGQRFLRLWSCQAVVSQSPFFPILPTPRLLSLQSCSRLIQCIKKVETASLLKPLAHYQAAREAGGPPRRDWTGWGREAAEPG